MWRLYADEGKGIVLGFRPSAFDALDCRITKVSYPEESLILPSIVSAIERSSGEEFSLLSGIERKLIPLSVRLLEATVSSKRQHWSYEREVRLGFSYDSDQYSSIEEYIEERELFGRMSKYSPHYDGERGYLYQSFGKRKGDEIARAKAFSEIHLGPNCSHTEYDVEMLLREAGYTDFVVKKSDVAWR